MSRGFALAEVLVAAAIVAIGLTAVAVAVPTASYAVREGGQLSGAAFLAQSRLDQVRRATWALLPGGEISDCLGASASADDAPATTACGGRSGHHLTFADEPAGAMPVPFDRYTRTVRIATCDVPGVCPVQTDNLRRITVTVAYVPTSAVGGNTTASPRPVVLTTLVARGL